MNDFKAESSKVRSAMLKAAERVFDSGWYVLGNEVIEFEKKWSKVCNVDYAVGVGNGMDAIEISLRALNIGPGDEVITTPMTAFASVLAILRSGAIPVLADIDSSTALLSSESVKRCVSKKTKAILLVHLYGQVRQMDFWVNFCEINQIALIEDCAQSHLASLGGKIAGSFGVAGAYSFYPTKNLGAIGDAGMVITNSAIVSDKSKRLRNYGQSERYHHPELGMNSRLDEIQAAILSERLNWLLESTERRQQIAKLYRAGIKNSLIRLMDAPEEIGSHVYHLFVISCDERDSLQVHLKENDIQALIHYPICVHQQESCLDIKRDLYGLNNSEKHAQTCLSLPCHPHMSDADVSKVIEAINSFKNT
jgi:dTDP-4-amino-4,6-dideoxygalactose transaminase